MARYPTRKRVYDLAGESHRNPDGSSRQGTLKGCLPGEPVRLIREPDNPHGSNAIFVADELGRGLGYISRDDSPELAAALDGGAEYTARIHELTGGVATAPSFGCRICVTWKGQEFRDYFPLRADQALYEHAPHHLRDSRSNRTQPTVSVTESESSAPTIKIIAVVVVGLLLLAMLLF